MSKTVSVPSEQWYGCYDTPRTSLFTRESNRHPAKMAVGLCFRILEHGERRGYWKPGDTILDPMAGIGTTLVCARVRGYEPIGVELEKHFYDLAVRNLDSLALRMNLARWGKILLGDARNLPALLGSTGFQPVQAGVASPPYADKQITGQSHFRSKSDPNGASAAAHNLDGYSAAVSSPPYVDAPLPSGVPFCIRVLAREGRWEEAMQKMREWDAAQIESGAIRSQRTDEGLRKRLELALEQMEGNYSPAGSVASPPYPSAFREEHPGTQGGKVAQEFERGGSFRGYTGSVSSPPYLMPEGGAKGIAVNGHTDDPTLAARQYKPENHGQAAAQIGNLRDPAGDIDAVLSSPPWENQTRGGVSAAAWSDPAKAAEISAARYRSGERKGHPATAQAIQAAMERDAQHENYGEAPGQIGRERGETYCSAMLQVYRGLWQVLRPGAVVALVTKNPVKDRKLRRLDLDTIRLMESAGPQGAPGFTLLEHHHAMLSEEKFPLFPGTAKRERKSFFKRLYERNGGIRVDWEDVLFFRRVP